MECKSDKAPGAEREVRAEGREVRRDHVVALWQLEVKAVLSCVPCGFVL